jgi:hypothetical protein
MRLGGIEQTRQALRERYLVCSHQRHSAAWRLCSKSDIQQHRSRWPPGPLRRNRRYGHMATGDA